jgi:hypothetical protein
MKKFIILGLIILSSTFVLSACTTKQKIGEELVEKTIEKQTGAKVDIDSQGENVTIKSDDGQTQYSAGGQAKLPDNFPGELIVTDDARIILSTSSEQSSSVAYISDLSQDVLKERYVKNLVEKGWKKETEVNTEKAFMINFSKDKINVVVTIGENNTKEQAGKSLVNVILAIEKE